MITRLYEFISGEYVQKSHFELSKFQYDLVRNYSDRHNTTIDSVLNIQKYNKDEK